MARIDRFVEALFRTQGDAVLLVSGEPGTLRRAGAAKPLTGSSLGRKLLAELVEEVAPAELADALAEEGSHRFAYGSPHGPVQIAVERRGERLRIEILPGADAPKATSEAGPGSARTEPGPAGSPAPAGAETREDGAELAAPRAVEPDASPSSTGSQAAPADTRAMDALFRAMVEHGCSDLHLCAGSPPLFRKDGAIQTLEATEPLDPARLRDMLYSITPPPRRAEFEERHDSDFSYEIPGVGRFRCNLFRDRKGMGGVFRLIPVEVLSAETLGLPESILKLCELSKGLVLVTGPTGSGKSTTLAAMVDFINRRRPDHIITIEDPIEFVHENKRCLINQREVGSHTEGFQSALRAALREDPDIVLVGEMRDLETVEIAIETAETGHLVFGTLHTNTAASTVDRIIDQFPTDRQGQIRTMLASSLKGVVAQTLCKKKGGGRVAALEILIVNHAVSNLIREGKTFQIASIMQTGRRSGMQTLNDALLDLVQRDLVEPEQAYAKAVDAAEFANLLKSRGIPLSVGPEPA